MQPLAKAAPKATAKAVPKEASKAGPKAAAKAAVKATAKTQGKTKAKAHIEARWAQDRSRERGPAVDQARDVGYDAARVFVDRGDGSPQGEADPLGGRGQGRQWGPGFELAQAAADAWTPAPRRGHSSRRRLRWPGRTFPSRAGSRRRPRPSSLWLCGIAPPWRGRAPPGWNLRRRGHPTPKVAT
jgi:hypothetical protein